MMDKQTMKIAGRVLGVIVVLAVAYFYVFVKQSAEYSIVYLSTGEVYVGHLSTFPRLKLTDGYVFQAVKDPADSQKTTFQLNPLKDALWAPQYLYLNEDAILFSGPLAESSSILKTLNNPAAAANNPANNQVTAPPQNNSATTPPPQESTGVKVKPK